MAVKVLELELTEQIRPVWGMEGYSGLYILARYRGRPVGWAYMTVREPVVSAERLCEVIRKQLAWELVPHVLGDTITPRTPTSTALPPISVIICTRDRTDQLKHCLRALLTLDYPDYEIIVVDNAPRSDETAEYVAHLPIRYVREERPGLDWARNCGIAEARCDIVTFTDDDARPDRYWLHAIAQAFDEPEVMAVTGLVAPAEMETQAQVRFELVYGGMGRGFRRRTVRRDTLTDRKLLWASDFGVGANMAYRRCVFADIGPFDVALDVGTTSGGGGDNEMFHRLVARGHTLVYEPAALVWHNHRRDNASLRRLVYNNGRSFGAYLLTCARNRTMSRRAILRFVVRQWLGWWLLRRLRRPGKLPRHLVAIELAGTLLSPLAYRTAQAQARNIATRKGMPVPVSRISQSPSVDQRPEAAVG